MIPVKYIGAKASKELTLLGTVVAIWACPGDIQPVDEKHIAFITQHPTVWEMLAAEELAAHPGDPPSAEQIKAAEDDRNDDSVANGARNFAAYEADGNVLQLLDLTSDEVFDLMPMTDTELKAFARTHGIKADLRKRGDELRSAIVATVVVAAEIPAAPKE